MKLVEFIGAIIVIVSISWGLKEVVTVFLKGLTSKETTEKDK